MNVIFISPHFPHHFYQFCARLKERGVTVPGIGGCPWEGIGSSCQNALTDYRFVHSLRNEGVDHIELRMVVLNPPELAGLNLRDLQFARLLLVRLASTPRQPFALKDQVQAVQNFKNAAHYDLKTVKIVAPDGEVYSVAGAGHNAIGFMREFYRDFPQEVLDILDFEEEKFTDPEKRCAWRIRRESANRFVQKGLALAGARQREAVSRV